MPDHQKLLNYNYHKFQITFFYKLIKNIFTMDLSNYQK